MASTSEILKKIQKEHGTSVVQKGVTSFADTIRIPTGVFPVDLAMGGGFPMGRVSIVYGPESSNKTNIVLCAIAQGQQMFPDKNAVLVDAESVFDPKWAVRFGIDLNRLIVVQPDYAEQAVDFLESFLYAEDVFMVALDSIAALVTANEVESTAEKASVGGPSLIVGKLFKKTVVSFNRMRNQGMMPPAFIAINQIRTKIGVMYGNPETMPGGFAPKFASSMTLRVYGKNIVDKKVNATMPCQKEVSVVLQKWKVPIVADHAVYTMNMIDSPHGAVGTCNDWNTVQSYLKELDYLSKGEKAGWVMFEDPYKTLEDCKQKLYGDPAMLRDAKQTIIKEVLEKGGIKESVDSDTGEVVVS